MITRLADGMTRTRIIDWVSTWSELNLESSSDPSSSTVKAPTWAGLGEGDGVGEVKKVLGEGDGTTTFTPVDWNARFAAGTKYANPPDPADSAMAGKRERWCVEGLTAGARLWRGGPVSYRAARAAIVAGGPVSVCKRLVNEVEGAPPVYRWPRATSTAFTINSATATTR